MYPTPAANIMLLDNLSNNTCGNVKKLTKSKMDRKVYQAEWARTKREKAKRINHTNSLSQNSVPSHMDLTPVSIEFDLAATFFDKKNSKREYNRQRLERLRKSPTFVEQERVSQRKDSIGQVLTDRKQEYNRQRLSKLRVLPNFKEHQHLSRSNEQYKILKTNVIKQHFRNNPQYEAINRLRSQQRMKIPNVLAKNKEMASKRAKSAGVKKRIVSRRKIKPRQKLPPSIKQLVRRWNRKILDSCLQFVCTCCSQQKYRDQVTPVTNKTGLFQRCCTDYMSVDNIEWICVSCSRQIRKGLVPEMAVLNGFKYASIPLQFSVTRLEELLCSARIPFMKIFSRPRGGQYASKGAVVNVPSNIDHTLKILPRPANDNCLLAVDLKRRTTDKTTYLSRYIRPKLVHEFAEWLCLQPLYVSEGIIYDSSITMQLELPPNIEMESDESDESSEDGEIAGSFDTLLNSRPLMDISLKTVTAPTSGETPLSIFTDEFGEEYAYPTLFAGQARARNTERIRSVSYKNICKAEMQNVIRKFARHSDNLFFKTKKCVIKRVFSNAQIAVRKRHGRNLRASDVKGHSLRNLFDTDKAYAFLANERFNPPYFAKMEKNFMALIRQNGPPSLFMTFSMAEAHWTDLLKIL